MKPLAIILIILVLAALVGVGYLYFTSNLTVTFSSVVATDPVDQAEAFDQLVAFEHLLDGFPQRPCALPVNDGHRFHLRHRGAVKVAFRREHAFQGLHPAKVDL